MVAQLLARVEPEPEELKRLEDGVIKDNGLIVFKGLGDYFKRLNGWESFLNDEICAVVKERWLSAAREVPVIPIGIHIRRGDFIEPKSYSDYYSRGSLRTPLTWFINSLKSIRETVGFDAKAFVFSDGSPCELNDLFKLRDVYPVRTGSAVSDLLALSRAGILLASGSSSFSAWASFLGQMPTVCHPGNPGQTLGYFNLVNRKGYYIGEYDPKTNIPEILTRQFRDILEAFR